MGIEQQGLERDMERLRQALVPARDGEDVERTGVPLDAVLRGVLDGITVLDSSGRMIFANAAAARLCGYPDADALVAAPPGDVLSRFDLFDDDGEPLDPNKLPTRDALAGVQPEERTIRWRPKGGGVDRWSLVKASPILGPDGAVQLVIVIFHDVTDRVRQYNESQRLVEELRETVRMNEMYAAILGHDLRNPLTAMISAAQMLMHREDSAELHRPLSRILASGARMNRMIGQLLDLARSRTRTGMTIRPARVNLTDVCQMAIDELAAAHPQRRVSFVATGSCDGVWDRDRLLQLVSNLVGNAIEHSLPETDVSVRLDGARSESVELRVSNQGAIPDELLPTLFDPFGMLERRDQGGRSGGLGLGLHITRLIARAHGSDVEVATSPEVGTTFCVVLDRVVPRRER